MNFLEFETTPLGSKLGLSFPTILKLNGKPGTERRDAPARNNVAPIQNYGFEKIDGLQCAENVSNHMAELLDSAHILFELPLHNSTLEQALLSPGSLSCYDTSIMMSSNSSNSDFWTKIQGICTIIGLGVGSILTLITLYLAILSYRQMNSIKQHIATPAFGEPPPPYADRKEEKSWSKKHLFGVLAVPVALSGRDSAVDDEMTRRNIRKEVRRGRLGQRRWFIALLIVMIILACGVIAVAANISNIQKLSNSKSLPQAAVIPNSNPNPGFATISFTKATTTSIQQTATSIVPGSDIYSTTYVDGTAFLVVPGPTSIAVGDVPDILAASTTTINGSPYIVVSGSTNIPIAAITATLGAIIVTTGSPSTTGTEDGLTAGSSLSSGSELSNLTSSSISLSFETQFVTVPTIIREVVIAGITFIEFLSPMVSGSQTSMSSSSLQAQLSLTEVETSVDWQSSVMISSRVSGSQTVLSPTPGATASSIQHGFLGFEVLSVALSSLPSLATSTQITLSSTLSSSRKGRQSTMDVLNRSYSTSQLSTAKSLPVSTSTTFKGGTIPAKTILSTGATLQTHGLSPLVIGISVSQSLDSQVNSTMLSSFTDLSALWSSPTQIESSTSTSSSISPVFTPSLLSTFSVVIITTSVVFETPGTTATSLEIIISTIPVFQTFQTTENSLEFSTSTVSMVETIQTTEASLKSTTFTVSTIQTSSIFEIFQMTATFLEFATSIISTIETSLVFQTLDVTATSLETLLEVTTSTLLTLQTSVVLRASDMPEPPMETIIAIPPEAQTSTIFQTSEVTFTSLDVVTSTLLLNQVVEITQTSLEIITTTLSLNPVVEVQTSDVTLTSMELITSIVLQTSLLFEISTLEETPDLQTKTVLQTSATDETFTIQEIETALETVTEVYTTVVVEKSLLYETFTVQKTEKVLETETVLETSTEVYSTTLFQKSLLYETSTTLQDLTVVQTSTVYETSTVLETSTILETSVVLETSTILETSLALDTSTLLETLTVLESLTEFQSEMAIQTSVLFETSTITEIYTSVIFVTQVSLSPAGPPLTFSTAIAPNPISTATPGTYSYQGCISDNANRTLGGLHTTSAMMTTEKCAKYCSDSAYFGTEYGSQCWCGDTIWEYAGIAPQESYCNTTCTGNEDEICGATWWMSLYQYDNMISN